MATLYLATLDTRHFHFEAIDTTEKGARAALDAGLDVHAFDYGIDLDWKDEYADDINVRPVEVGGAYRDGELLARKASRGAPC